MTYLPRKFPSLDEENWARENREFVAGELEKYKDLFKEEELNSAFRDLMVEYLFLHSLTKDVAEWRDQFLRHLADMVETTENGLERKDSVLDRGKLLILRDILQWF
jgi:hypothetical protein